MPHPHLFPIFAFEFGASVCLKGQLHITNLFEVVESFLALGFVFPDLDDALPMFGNQGALQTFHARRFGLLLLLPCFYRLVLLLVFSFDHRFPLLHLDLSISGQLLGALVLDRSDLLRRSLLHLSALARGILLPTHAPVSLVLLLDQASNRLRFLLLQEHFQLCLCGLFVLLRLLVLLRFGQLLLLDDVQLGQSGLSLLVGFLKPLRGLELLELALCEELRDESLSRRFALHQGAMELFVVVGV
mmetsp:Transcript_59568/g.126180  ORF Transcript_59568/g.126180 Transcript_59568/m.126180 type:complete len:244 (+) Transcript_59568:1084-1815(+)